LGDLQMLPSINCGPVGPSRSKARATQERAPLGQRSSLIKSHLCLPEVQAKPRTDPWTAARRARGSANRPGAELGSPVRPGSCQAQVRDPPTAQFFPVPKGWDDAAPLTSLHTLDDYREIPQTSIETKIHHSNCSLVQISNTMVTRSHPGDSGRPLDGLPALASGVVFSPQHSRVAVEPRHAMTPARPQPRFVGRLKTQSALPTSRLSKRYGLLEATASRAAAYVRAWKS
jgi:hypothetical protein